MAKKTAAYLKEENLLTLLSQNNFIIPEIQREYVWGNEEKVVRKFLKDVRSKVGVFCASCHLPHADNNINIGFLYSYKPDYVKVEHDRFLDENLIDGQQRFTTLFLLLFYCALKEHRSDGKNRKEEFLTLIRFEEKLHMCFDFKVRDLTRQFLLELVEKVNEVGQLAAISEQTWFLRDYEMDVSIQAMNKTLEYIGQEFNDNNRYFNHLINNVVFWHFKTEATSQGEELYITMNARGEELSVNEITKAALMINGTELYANGKEWEEWQQFFWKNRDRNDNNPSADKGFNGFIRCIAGLEYYISDKDEGRTKGEREIQSLLTLQLVGEYMEAFKHMLACKEKVAAHYQDLTWFDRFVTQVWDIFNRDETDWFVDYNDSNKNTERNRMVLVWSWLLYMRLMKGKGREIDPVELVRVIRLFWVRFNNFNRSVPTLFKTISLITVNDIYDTMDNEMRDQEGGQEEETDWKFYTAEESMKNHYFQQIVNDEERFKLEQLIWSIEDMPLNLDGNGVGGVNISHLIDLNVQPSEEEILQVKGVFERVFPGGKAPHNAALLKTVLLHYGEFYWSDSYIYTRFEYANWKRNIRKKEFRSLLHDLVHADLETLLELKSSDFLLTHRDVINNATDVLPENYSLNKKLIIYSILLSYRNLWEAGSKIIVRNPVESTRLFKDDVHIIYNSKKNFNSVITDLWLLAEKKFPSPLARLKELAVEL